MTLLNLYYISSRLVTLLKVTDATVQVSDTSDLVHRQCVLYNEVQR